MTRESEDTFRLDVAGVLRRAEFDVAQAALARDMPESGPIKLFLVLDHFEGWNPHDNWSGLNFYVTHGDRISRIAIVGEARWRSQILMFALADVRQASVTYFDEHAVDQARAWLSA